MSTEVRIQGGAGEMEAAVIAVVLDQIDREEAAARHGKGQPDTTLPAWVRAIRPEESRLPWEIVRPD